MVLGHELHENATMDFDCKCKRARFIDSSTSIRETFKFAENQQVLRAVQVYSCDFYGSMLWNLYGDQAGKFYRCWNTCVKLSWDVPRSTHTYFVDNLLSCGFPSIRQQILTRYVKFYRTLLKSPSKEVAVVAKIVAANANTTTGSNLLNIRLETRLCIKTSPIHKFKEVLSNPKPVPSTDMWRINLLPKYLEIRKNLQLQCENTKFIDGLIESLCIN